MLVLTKNQIQRLEGAQARSFETGLLAHVERFAPALAASASPSDLRAAVALGIANARRHGFTLQGSIRFYVETTFLLGSDFDTDPQYRRVVAPLSGPRGPDELDRADALHENVSAYVRLVSGDGHRHEDDALDRAAGGRFAHVAEYADRPVADAVDLLRRIHPEKVTVIGPAAVAALVEAAREFASSRPAAQRGGWPLFAALMFTFGHRCFADPLFRWTIESLDDDVAAADPPRAIERLFDRFAVYLRQARRRRKVS